jgi:hypothetical protein
MRVLLDKQDVIKIFKSSHILQGLTPVGQVVADLDFRKDDVGEIEVMVIFDQIKKPGSLPALTHGEADEAGDGEQEEGL